MPINRNILLGSYFTSNQINAIFQKSFQTGAVSIEACQPCLPGYYCAKGGLSSPSGPCSPGYYCREGSKTATPLGNVTGNKTLLLALYIVVIIVWHYRRNRSLYFSNHTFNYQKLRSSTQAKKENCQAEFPLSVLMVLFNIFMPLSLQSCGSLHKTLTSPCCFLIVFFLLRPQKMPLAFIVCSLT